MKIYKFSFSFFDKNVRVKNQNKTKKQLFNQSSIDNNEALSLTLNQSVTRKSISKKRIDLDYQPDNLENDSDESIQEPEKIIKKSNTQENIEYKSLEVFKELSQSPNTKIIITDGTTPMIIDSNVKKE